jgi:hypothetical protein
MAMLGSGRQLLVEWLFRAENGSYGRRRSMSIFGLPYRPHVSKQPTPVTWSALHGDSELLQSCSAAEADIPGGATKGSIGAPEGDCRAYCIPHRADGFKDAEIQAKKQVKEVERLQAADVPL